MDSFRVNIVCLVVDVVKFVMIDIELLVLLVIFQEVCKVVFGVSIIELCEFLLLLDDIWVELWVVD